MIFMDKHLSLQVSLNVGDFVMGIIIIFFKQKLCTSHDVFDSALCAVEFWFRQPDGLLWPDKNITPYFLFYFLCMNNWGEEEPV